MELIIDLDGYIHEVFSKAEVEKLFKELQLEIEKMPMIDTCDYAIDNCVDRFKIENLIQDRIDKLKGDRKTDYDRE